MKNIIYKFSFAFIAILISLNTYAQNNSNKIKNNRTECISKKYNPEQKEKLKKIHLSFAIETNDYNNELNERLARQKTLFSSQNPNNKDIEKNIEEIARLKHLIRKSKIKMQIQMKSLTKNICNKQGNFKTDDFHKKGNKRKVHKAKKTGMMSYLIDLSDDQKNKIQELKLQFNKETKSIKNELELLKLKQKHLIENEKIDLDAINSIMDKSLDLKIQIAKRRVKLKIECNQLLTKEQFLLKQSTSKKKKHHNRA